MAGLLDARRQSMGVLGDWLGPQMGVLNMEPAWPAPGIPMPIDDRFGGPGRTARGMDTLAQMPQNIMAALLSLPQRALEGAAQYRPGSGDIANMDRAVGPATETALNMVGIPGGVGGLGAGARIPKGIKAYHGSPHDFDKFSLEKIGTGEGAQAYGHGLYFAENPRVATEYRERLSPVGAAPEQTAQSLLTAHGGDRVSAIAEIDRRIAAVAQLDPKYRGSTANLEAARAMLGTDKPIGAGKTYEVSINAHPDEFLDWDKPLSEQPQKVREAVKQYLTTPTVKDSLTVGIDNLTGGQLYEHGYSVRTRPRRQTAVDISEALRAAGIKGIRYLDQGSRGAKGGTSNYVVFDSDTIEILKKYGIAGLTAGGLGGAALMGGNGQAKAGQ